MEMLTTSARYDISPLRTLHPQMDRHTSAAFPHSHFSSRDYRWEDLPLDRPSYVPWCIVYVYRLEWSMRIISSKYSLRRSSELDGWLRETSHLKQINKSLTGVKRITTRTKKGPSEPSRWGRQNGLSDRSAWHPRPHMHRNIWSDDDWYHRWKSAIGLTVNSSTKDPQTARWDCGEPQCDVNAEKAI